jgi:hypothetical protein
MGRDPNIFESVVSDVSEDSNAAITNSSDIDPACPITDLAIGSTDHMVMLASKLPLPRLVRLHVSEAIRIEPETDLEDTAHYRELFDDFSTIASIWQSLQVFEYALK